MNGLDLTSAPQAGRQNVIRGSGALPDAAEPSTPAAITGIAWPTGTYNFSIPVSGAGAVDVVLRTSASTGTGLSSTATIQATLNDGVTLKGSTTATSATFVNGTAQILSLVALRGEKVVNLRLVVPATSSVTFDVAEYSAR